MRALLAVAAWLAWMASAAAVPSPYPARMAPSPAADTAIVLEPVGAMLESGYFHAPRQPAFSPVRLFPCRPRLHTAAQTHRIEQICD
jgi:hypothetical protein